jgi:hypothetical protein
VPPPPKGRPRGGSVTKNNTKYEQYEKINTKKLIAPPYQGEAQNRDSSKNIF